MSTPERPIALGEPLPDVALDNVDGGETRLSSLRGRPLVIVCVRYYG
jgi:peroxiredoxin